MIFRVYPDPLGLRIKPSDPSLKPAIVLHSGDINSREQLGNLICPALQVYPYAFGDIVEFFESANATQPVGSVCITPTGLAPRHTSN